MFLEVFQEIIKGDSLFFIIVLRLNEMQTLNELLLLLCSLQPHSEVQINQISLLFFPNTVSLTYCILGTLICFFTNVTTAEALNLLKV